MSSIQKSCQRCSVLFICDPKNIDACQCNITLKSETRAFLKKTSYECLCVQCLWELDQTIKDTTTSQKVPFSNYEEGLHYYIEDGRWVFTEYFHITRGYCCQSGCRHCAYGFRKTD